MNDPAAPRIPCYVCQSPATIIDEPANATKRLNCPQCGKYSISYGLFGYVPAGERRHWNRDKPLLSLALRWASNHGTPAVLGDGGDVVAAILAYTACLLAGGIRPIG
jgi:hypothetical protein